MNETKQCTRCGETLPITAFYKNSRLHKRVEPECKVCKTERSKANQRRRLHETKPCNMCGEVKVLDDYPIDRSLKSGRGGRCKACKQESNRKYYINTINNGPGRHRTESLGDPGNRIHGTYDHTARARCSRCGSGVQFDNGDGDMQCIQCGFITYVAQPPDTRPIPDATIPMLV